MAKEKVKEVINDQENEEVQPQLSLEETIVQAGGPSPEVIAQWKAQFEDVYCSSINNQIYIYRSLSRQEYREVMGIPGADPMYQEERIVEKCLLFPKFDVFQMRKKAGTISSLADQIMRASDFVADFIPIKL